jgi:Kef-type K+ transport system membrane component KefB
VTISQLWGYLPKILKKSEKLIKHHDKIIFLFSFSYIIVSALLFEINILYSSLIIGIVLRKSNIHLFDDSIRRIESISLSFFIPLYFALVGLRIDFINYFHFGRFLLYFCISSAITIASVVIVLLLFKTNKQLIASFAISTAAKGGPGIVLATLGLEYQIINLEFFTTLILSSILSSLLAGLFLKLKLKNTNIDFDQV